ncbi:MAG: (d)CMP kinase [Methyloligellaceae bacterium]
MIIAVDGPAASGKGTLAKGLAAHFGFRHLDTGALYRAVARDILGADGDLSDPAYAAAKARQIDPDSLDDPGLRAPGVGEAASVVAQHALVREALLDFQRAFSRQPPGAILDGRDIGTVVCPDAQVKLFVTASPEARADRRHRELAAGDASIDYDSVLAEILKRDARDQERAAAPLKPASDAHLLDTTNLDIEAAFKAAIELIEAAKSP